MPTDYVCEMCGSFTARKCEVLGCDIPVCDNCQTAHDRVHHTPISVSPASTDEPEIVIGVNWRLLKYQQLALSNLIEEHYASPKHTLPFLDGIRSFLEALTDAYEDRYGELGYPTQADLEE